MEKGEIEEIKRYFGVVAEGLRSEIRQAAEGHDIIREEIKQFREEVKEEFKEVIRIFGLGLEEIHSVDPR